MKQKNSRDSQPEQERNDHNMSFWMAVGIIAGVAIGSFFKKIGLAAGIAIGLLIGMIMAEVMKRCRK